MAASTLVLSPGLRYQTFRAISEAPGIAAFFLLRGEVIRRDFNAASQTLSRQLSWSLSYGLEQSVLVPSLIENTAYVLNAAALGTERESLTPYLKKLADSYPALYRPQLWLGQALALTRPAEALASLEKAASIVAIDEQIYRAAILAADKLGDPKLLGSWCLRYQNATAGGSHPYQFNPLTMGVGVRRVIAEIPNGEKSPALIEFNALTPGRENVLEFSLPAASEHRELVLHFGTVPSVVLDFKELILMENGIRTARITNGLVFQSRQGYMIDDRKILLANAFGERVTVSWPSRGAYRADRILAIVRVGRAPLTNLAECSP